MARVKIRVYVRGSEGREALLLPGDTVPDWADVTNPDALLDDETETPEVPADETETPEVPADEKPAPAKRAPRRKATAPASE